jgi:HEAT repeat protein
VDPVTPNIWQLQSRVDIDGLTAALSHADPEIRRKAAAALRALDAAGAIPALKDALATETDWEAQATLLAAVQHLTREDTLDVLIEQRNVEALVNLLFSDWTHDVLGAIEALGELGEKQATESLVVIFRSTELPDELRYAAAEALLRLESAPAVVTLLAALRRDDGEVRLNAASMLGELHATWATRGLIDALEDPEAEVREAARMALEKIGTPTALKALESVDVGATQMLDALEETPAVEEAPAQLELLPAEDEPLATEALPVAEVLSAEEVALTAEELPEAEAAPAEESLAEKAPVEEPSAEAEPQPAEESEPEAEQSPAVETPVAGNPSEEAPTASDDDPYATTELPTLPASEAVDPSQAPQPVQPEELFAEEDVEENAADSPEADQEEDPQAEATPEASDEQPDDLPDAELAPDPDLDNTLVYEDIPGEPVYDEDDLDIPYNEDTDDPSDEDSASFYPVDVAF